MMGTKTESSRQVVRVHNLWAICPIPDINFLLKKKKGGGEQGGGGEEEKKVPFFPSRSEEIHYLKIFPG